MKADEPLVQPQHPWSNPKHDVLADLRHAKKLAEQMPPRRELHCARDVADAISQLFLDPPEFVSSLPAMVMDALFSLPIVIKADLPSGCWEFRYDDGTIVDSGKLEVL